jgi:hypothetical protein
VNATAVTRVTVVILAIVVEVEAVNHLAGAVVIAIPSGVVVDRELAAEEDEVAEDVLKIQVADAVGSGLPVQDDHAMSLRQRRLSRELSRVCWNCIIVVTDSFGILAATTQRKILIHSCPVH